MFSADENTWDKKRRVENNADCTTARVSFYEQKSQDGCRARLYRLARHIVDAAPILHRRTISRSPVRSTNKGRTRYVGPAVLGTRLFLSAPLRCRPRCR